MNRFRTVAFLAPFALLAGVLVGTQGSALASTDSEPTIEPPSAQDCENPADVLDLNDWKIQLPIGEEESPDEVEHPDLASYQADPWFTVAAECDGVLFRSAVNGVTTGGSSYPRSELREMSDAENAEWASTDGTHVMTIDQTVTHLPNDKQHLVVGQIHGGDDDVSVFRVEDNSLYVTNGDDSNYQLVTDDFQLNTRFQVKFVVSDGTINAYYNGDLAASLDADFSSGYFKAGAYTQANCDNSSPCDESNYGEVIIHDVTVGEDDSVPSPDGSPPSEPSGNQGDLEDDDEACQETAPFEETSESDSSDKTEGSEESEPSDESNESEKSEQETSTSDKDPETPENNEACDDSEPTKKPEPSDEKPAPFGNGKDGGGLPVTGSALTGLIIAAIVALGTGATAMYLSRKRRTATLEG